MNWIPFIKKGRSIFLLPVNTSVILTPGLNSGINFTQKTGVRISKRLSMGLEMPLNILEDTPIRSPFPTAASVPLRKIRSPFPQEVKSQETPAGSSLCPMKNSCDAIWCMSFPTVFKRSATMDSWTTVGKVKTWNWSSHCRDISGSKPDIQVCRSLSYSKLCGKPISASARNVGVATCRA